MSEPIDLRQQPLYSVDQYPVDKFYRDDLEGILIPEGNIKSRVSKLSEEISRDFYPKEVLALVMLDGALKFFVDLFYNPHMRLNFEYGTSKAKSYLGTNSTGEVIFSGFDFSEVEGKNVLIIEDIIDSGMTMQATLKKVQDHKPNSLSIATLLRKPARHKVEIESQYTGFLIPDEFVVGYGMDADGDYRGIPHLCVLKDSVIEEIKKRN